MVRITPMLPSLEPADGVSNGTWAALAVVLVSASAVFYAAAWLVERWQLS